MPPEPQAGAAEPTSAPLVAAAARAEEEEAAAAEIAALPIPPWTTDDELVALWLHGKSQNTIRAYGEDVAAFRAFTGKGLRSTYLWDLQRYADAALAGAPATRARRLRALKSLLSFAAKMGYLPFNVGAAIRGPKLEHTLAERILSEQQVFALLDAVEDRPRDHALIRLLYNGYICPSPRKVPKRVNYDFSRRLSLLDEPPRGHFLHFAGRIGRKTRRNPPFGGAPAQEL